MRFACAQYFLLAAAVVLLLFLNTTVNPLSAGVDIMGAFATRAAETSRRPSIAPATQTLAPRSSHQDTEPGYSTVSNNTAGVSFVTSHFAMFNRSSVHYLEIEDAIRINLANPALSEVVIMYDSVDTVRDGCTELTARLLAGLANMSVVQQARLRCFESQRQPSYRDMFNFASTTVQPGSVVVMSNADCTMGPSAMRLTRIQNSHAVVISLASNLLPAKEPFGKVQRSFGLDRCRPAHRCHGNNKLRAPASWDAYAFRVPIPFINESTLPDNLYMNANYAESKGGQALRKVGLHVTNICLHVSLIALHCGSKMHRPNSLLKPDNSFIPRLCSEIDQCLGLSA